MNARTRRIASMLAGVPGVIRRQSAAPGGGGGAAGPPRWPERRPPARDDLVHERPRRVRRLRPVTTRDETGRFVVVQRDEVERIHWCRRAGEGLLRQLADDEGRGLRLEFLSSWTLRDPAPPRPGDLPIDTQEGVRMRLRMPAPTGPPRGVLVHLRGLGGHAVEDAALEPFRVRGRAILEVVYPLVRWTRVVADLADPASVAAAAASFADIIDHRFSEIACAVEAVLERWTGTPLPAAAADDVVVVGFSAGGNASSAVAARLGARCSALAIVAAGADLMDISLRCGLPDTGFDCAREGRPVDRRRLDPADSAALSAAYFSRARMDGLVVAPSIRAPRRLLVEGIADAIIPPPAGARLHAALGRPERWRCLGGHRGAYALLPGRRNELVARLEG